MDGRDDTGMLYIITQRPMNISLGHRTSLCMPGFVSPVWSSDTVQLEGAPRRHAMKREHEDNNHM